MSSERRKILDMLAEGKVTPDEAERLLGALDAGPEGDQSSGQSGSLPFKYLRVRVEPHPEAGEGSGDRVNIRVPLALLRAGIKLGSLIPHEASGRVKVALAEKGIDFDLRKVTDEQINDLIAALADLEVDVQDKEHYVRIGVE